MSKDATIPPALMVDVDKLPADQGVAKLIDHAATMGASDLFLVANEGHLAVQVRHLGMILPISVVPSEQGKRYQAHIRANAGMDVSDKRHPSDGRWIYNRDEGEIIDLRINTIPTMYGEDFAIRLLDRGSALHNIENLGLGKDQFQHVQVMLESPAGLVLICGPTGSGKTSTLYSALVRLNNGRRKINTIEDPIEYAMPGVRQSQVNPAINLHFPELLRSVLRQSPDVVMIGEIRDAETAQTAVHAANSGILVLATIHAPSAAGAIQAMRAWGTHSHFLATALRGVVAQRLARTLCPNCSVTFDLSDAPHTFDEVRSWLGPEEGKLLYAARGCEQCRMTGYAGRTGIFEVMAASKALRNLISDNQPTREIRAKAIEERMLEFRQSALLKVARGQTSTEEVFRVIPTEHLLLDD